ncbi:ribonuclease H-like domain-containing protein [Tanacetum coccineum]
MQKYILKQQFEGFYVSNTEGLHKGYDMFQSLLSQLEIHGAGVSTEDVNQKFLRSLPSAWSQVSLIMRTKPGVDCLSFDDLYNNLRVFESDIKGSTASSSSPQNVAFVSENTSSTNDVSTAYCVPNPSGGGGERGGGVGLGAHDLIENEKFYKKTGRYTTILMQKNQLALIKPKLNATIATRQGILLESVESREIKTTEEGMHGIQEPRMGAEAWMKGTQTQKFGLGMGITDDDGILSYDNEVFAECFFDKEREGWNVWSGGEAEGKGGKMGGDWERAGRRGRWERGGRGGGRTGDYRGGGELWESDEKGEGRRRLRGGSRRTWERREGEDEVREGEGWGGKRAEVRGGGGRTGRGKEVLRWERGGGGEGKRREGGKQCWEVGGGRAGRQRAREEGGEAKYEREVGEGAERGGGGEVKRGVGKGRTGERRGGGWGQARGREARGVEGRQGGREEGAGGEGGLSGTKNVSTARQSFNRQAVLTSTAMKVNTVKPIAHDWKRPNLLNFKISLMVAPVAFGGSNGYITSFNLENIVPSGGLACLIAKATTDESNKWHRRLGHVNFKNLNKLVKGNLVREFKNKDVIEFCGSKGIKREYSNARTPQQNGVAERKNRTLLEC